MKTHKNYFLSYFFFLFYFLVLDGVEKYHDKRTNQLQAIRIPQRRQRTIFQPLRRRRQGQFTPVFPSQIVA